MDAHADYERLQRMMPGDESVASELRKIKDRLLRRSTTSSSSAVTTPSASPTFRSPVESRALVPAGTCFSSSSSSSSSVSSAALAPYSRSSSDPPAALPALPSTLSVTRSTSSLSGLSNSGGNNGSSRGLARQSSLTAGRPATAGGLGDGSGNVRMIASEEEYGKAVANMGE